MTVKHHPGEELLLDYAAGTLGEAWSLAVATHLALCTKCRSHVAEFESVGGALLEDETPAAMSADGFANVLQRIADAPRLSRPDPAPASSARPPILPEPLRGYVGGDVGHFEWRRLGLGAHQLVIPTGEDGVTARLLRIPAGKPVPEHTHGGLELTLVLAGAFSDATGTYCRGDLQQADDTIEHTPHAAPNEDCICLAITDAPLRFTSFAARMVQPVLGI